MKKEAPAPNCDCPCLPKCCPPRHVLSTKDRLHGLSCQPANELVTLPQVPIVDRDGSARNMEEEKSGRFFHSVFPSCEGVSDDPNKPEQWNYTWHTKDLFVLETKSMFKYILYTHRHVLDSENQTKNGELIYANVSSRMVNILYS